MKIINQLLHPVKKFSKGILAVFAVNLLFILGLFVFDSCKKSAYESSPRGKANNRFLASLEQNRKSIAATVIANNSNKQPGNNQPVAARMIDTTESVYINFPGEVSPVDLLYFDNANSIQGLTDLIHEADATVQYEPTPVNSQYELTVPVQQVISSLNPLVTESKQFLYSRGFTESDIQQMIQEENALETDLIPLVMAVTQAENSQVVARNYMNYLPVSSANALTWSEVGSCAMEALGADILFSLGQSTATVWSMAAIKTAFKTVAKRMLGPIGVAIAVVDFSWCLMR